MNELVSVYDVPDPSMIEVVATGIPSSVAEVFQSNPVQVFAEFATNSPPAWWIALPSDVQAFYVSQGSAYGSVITKHGLTHANRAPATATATVSVTGKSTSEQTSASSEETSSASESDASTSESSSGTTTTTRRTSSTAPATSSRAGGGSATETPAAVTSNPAARASGAVAASFAGVVGILGVALAL